MTLLGQRGVTVIERSLGIKEFLEADEVFSTGNFAKVLPICRIEDRTYPEGPVTQLARKAYWEWAVGQASNT